MENANLALAFIKILSFYAKVELKHAGTHLEAYEAEVSWSWRLTRGPQNIWI